jgi:hypothetical protein
MFCSGWNCRFEGSRGLIAEGARCRRTARPLIRTSEKFAARFRPRRLAAIELSGKGFAEGVIWIQQLDVLGMVVLGDGQ